MDEETNKTGEGTTQDTNDGNKSEAASVLDRTNQAIERLAAENARMEALNKERAELIAMEKLSGTAGGRTQETQPEETNKEFYARLKREIREGKYNDKG